MTLRLHNQSIFAQKAVVALSLLLTTMSGSVQVVCAQDMSPAGSFSSSGTIGADQDSLLPPEVVPLDPSVANTMSSTQAQNRQAEISNNNSVGNDASVPGLVDDNPNSQAQGMQHVKDFRKAAFESLYNQQPQQPMQMDAGVSFDNYGQQPGAPGQQPGVNAYQPGTMANAGGPPQSQTLSGGSKIKPKVRDIRRAGFSNTLSAVAGFGAGALTAGYLMRPQNMWMGAGLFGLSMTGFGVRNGFRF